MTLPPVIRIFFAIDLPEAVKEQLAQFISQLKKKSKSHAIRWTKPDHLHITLQFLAEIKSEHLPALIEKVREKVEKKVKHFDFSIGPVHLFPNPYRPRVIVLDILPQADIAALAALIGQCIQEFEYEIDTRPFRGHLTLGRMKHPHIKLDFLSEVSIPTIEAMVMKEVVLFRSEPQPEGSMYSVLNRIPLASE